MAKPLPRNIFLKQMIEVYGALLYMVRWKIMERKKTYMGYFQINFAEVK